jgi:hypothetical protein
MATILSYPIAPVPMSIFHADSTMRNTNKADFRHQLENQSETIFELPESSKHTTVYIIDAIYVIQIMDGDKFNSFDTLPASYYRHLLTGFQKAETIIEVFGRYDENNSVKTAERDRRAGYVSAYKTYQVIGRRPVPSWKKNS